MTNKNKIKPQIVVAGFYDILGFRSLIDISNYNWRLAIRQVKIIESLLKDNFTHYNEQVFIRIFSDNIYISFPLLVNNELRVDNFFWFIWRLFDVQWHFIKKGYFLRGGISVGTQYVSPFTIFGTALAKAYIAENKIAKVPRVIVDNSFLEALNSYKNKIKDTTLSNIKRLIKKDDDENFYVDYLKFFDNFDYSEKDRRQILLEHKKQIIKQLKENSGKEDIMEKYIWVAKYHNEYAQYYNCVIDIDKCFASILRREDSK
jgi:hypothetical protein